MTATTVPAPSDAYTVVERCRACRRDGLVDVLDLGAVPLADVFPRPEDAALPDLVYPLHVGACPACSLLQLREDVPVGDLFDDAYLYRSSSSAYLVDHARNHVRQLIADRGLGPDHTVVEIASNDGYLLQHVVDAGVRAVGIDPVAALADDARERGVATISAFFDAALAREMRADGISADVVIANNVLAHVSDLADVLEGIRVLLAPGGIARIEVPWVLDLLDTLAFDTLYHEHRCTFSVTALEPLLSTHGLQLVHVEHLDVHGGSLRLHVDGGEGAPSPAVIALRSRERDVGVADLSAYERFGAAVRDLLPRLRTRITDEVSRHGPLAGYGAAAKGTTLANVLGLTTDELAWVVDRNPAKVGRLVAGLRAPIRPVAALVDEMPPVTLLLAWNAADEIRRQQVAYLQAGGRFLVPVPTPRLVPA